MGIELLHKAKEKCKKEYVFAFLVAFLGGLFVHMYKFTNNLPNHDSMYNFYSDQNVVGSGRWFLSIACGFSSYYDLPWLNGIVSMVLVGCTAVVIVCVMKIKNPVAIFLTASLLVTYPAITETLCFEFTADGYMLAMLLSALSVLVIIKCKNKWLAVIMCSGLLCLTCAIYQAYISFAIVLFLCWVILAAFDCEFKIKNYFGYIFQFVVSAIMGLVVFYGIWKVCLSVQNVAPNDYQGISGVGFLNFSEMIIAIKNVIMAFVRVILEKNIFKHGISLYSVINIAFILFSLIVLIVAFIKTRMYRSRVRFLTTVICLLVVPLAVCMWQFVSIDVVYSLRMMQSLVLVYILMIVLCERYIKGNLSIAFVLLNVIMISNLCVQANVAYYYLNYEYENSYAEAVRLEYAIEEVCKEYNYKYKVAIIGHREAEVALNQDSEVNKYFMYTNMIEKSLLLDSVHTRNFLKNVLYFDGEFADSDILTTIESTEEYKKMKPWFDGGTIEIIDDVITVKLG